MASFSIIIVIIFSLVGVSIALNYRKNKEKVYILFGLTWIGIVEAWIPSGIILIGYIFTNRSILSPQLFFLIAIVGYPASTLIWITAFTELLYKEKQRLIQLIFGIGEGIFEIIFIYLLFTDVNSIGTFKSPVDVSYRPIVAIYIFLSLSIIFTTGLLISIRSIRDEEKANKTRGWFLLAALITLFIGGLLDAISDFDLLGVVLVRLFVISSAIEFYFAFVMPDYIKRILKIEI